MRLTLTRLIILLIFVTTFYLDFPLTSQNMFYDKNSVIENNPILDKLFRSDPTQENVQEIINPLTEALLTIHVSEEVKLRNTTRTSAFDDETTFRISTINYTTHSPIIIDGNADFLNQTLDEGWSGNGSQTDPILIQNYNFSGVGTLIQIQNINLFFNISTCHLSHGTVGIQLINVSNGFIAHNIFLNNTYGINLTLSNHIEVVRNEFHNTTYGLHGWNTNNTVIRENDISNASIHGVFFRSCMNITVHQNTIYNNSIAGIALNSSHNSIISANRLKTNWLCIDLQYCNNTIMVQNDIGNTNGYGINVFFSSYNDIEDNYVHNIQSHGIKLWGTHDQVHNNYFENNRISLRPSTKSNVTGNTFRNGSYVDIFINSHNTTISDNTIIDCTHGIYLGIAKFNTVLNNTILNATEEGIFVLHSSQNNTFLYNHISFSAKGILVDSSYNNSIVNNTFYRTGRGVELRSTSKDNEIRSNNFTSCVVGLLAKDCSSNRIVKNSIFNASFWGIMLWDSKDFYVAENTLSNSTRSAIMMDNTTQTILTANIISNTFYYTTIDVFESFNNTLSENVITGSDGYGIELDNSDLILVENNTIFRAGRGIIQLGANNITIRINTISQTSQAIILAGSSESNILNNTIHDNYQGLWIYGPSFNNFIAWNNFVGNYQIGSQAKVESELSNIFSNNFWDDWREPDVNLDQIVDYPYKIAWLDNHYDLSPRVKPNQPLSHILSHPHFTYPYGGYVLRGVENITWRSSYDLSGHSFTYLIDYSIDGGNTWIRLASNLTQNYYEWNTSSVPDGTTYQLKIIVNCSEGIGAEYQSTSIFTIDNHYLTELRFLNPSVGSTIRENYTIRWENLQDSLNHSIIYNLYFSSDSGTTWVVLSVNLTSPSYIWNTLTVPEGENYTLKVIASCTEGLFMEQSLTGTFTINNHYIPFFRLTYPNGGEILQGTVTIWWVDAKDSLNHSITYDLYYSPDAGTTWVGIVLNQTISFFEWNTSDIPNGDDFLLKVVLKCSNGLEIEDISSSLFTIANIESTTNLPSSNVPETLSSDNIPDSTSSTFLTTPAVTTFSMFLFVLPTLIIYTIREKKNRKR